ncbi:MBL fold metallo-hydrolase [Clostridium sp. MSJ-11]|uniref:MBL fold metallo-hydrolase n=1 Tax=Clostridium mobile TaxID=2841512 RepID=A0ABS6ELJ7_9CLOT|nr:MBL fold metallo-hydrolase [Clostridium mobile]MBU5485546.1 MBL fold metallo-hydrolase [Clostridium mobile]
MKINRLPVGSYAANCYIVMDDKTKETMVIDPGAEASLINNEIKKMGGKVKYIFLTHGHLDHTGAVSELKELTNALVGINEKDEKAIEKGGYVFGDKNKFGRADIHLKDGDEFQIGDIKINCIETPGHSEGGMCFLLKNVVFTGDTLFEGSIGRTDFEGGDFKVLIDSIKNKLLNLPKETVILPGHGGESRIDYEKMYNPFL